MRMKMSMSIGMSEEQASNQASQGDDVAGLLFPSFFFCFVFLLLSPPSSSRLG